MTFDVGLDALYPRSESARLGAAMRCVAILENDIDV
jgi:hypothetical protein